MTLKNTNALIIAAFVLSAVGAVWTGIALYGELTSSRDAAPLGTLIFEEDPALRTAIDGFLSGHFTAPDSRMSCRHDFFGRDDLYAFVGFSCAQLAKDAGAPVEGGRTLDGLARIELKSEIPTTINVLESGETRESSKKLLFPPGIRERLPVEPAG